MIVVNQCDWLFSNKSVFFLLLYLSSDYILVKNIVYIFIIFCFQFI